MAFDIKTSDAEAKLYRKLEDIESLRKKIIPELAELLSDSKAYEATVTLIDDGDGFRIDHRLVGAKDHTIIDVKFASATATGDYKVTWCDGDGSRITSEMVGRPDLVDMIESMIRASDRGNKV